MDNIKIIIDPELEKYNEIPLDATELAEGQKFFDENGKKLKEFFDKVSKERNPPSKGKLQTEEHSE